jgi:hypothetical protein
MSYRSWLSKILPTSFAREWSEKLGGLYELVFDMIGELRREAIKVRFVYADTFPMDALPSAGSDRSMPRYPIETDAGYLQRLKGAWTAWAIAGTSPGVAAQFTAMGYRNDWKEAGDWNWDNQPDDWSRFWILLLGHPFTRWTLGDGHHLDDGVVLGSTAQVSDVALMRKTARKWKSGHVRLSHIVIVFDETAFALQQPDGTWQDVNQRSAAVSCIPG